jgi:hypothetical protein
LGAEVADFGFSHAADAGIVCFLKPLASLCNLRSEASTHIDKSCLEKGGISLSGQLLDAPSLFDHDDVLTVVSNLDGIEIDLIVVGHRPRLKPPKKALRDVRASDPTGIERYADKSKLGCDGVNSNDIDKERVSPGEIRRSVGLDTGDSDF